MNKLCGIIKSIESSAHMSLVDIAVGADTVSAFVLDTPHTAEYLKSGIAIEALFKETDVTLCRCDTSSIGCDNCFTAAVFRLERSLLLTKISLWYGNAMIRSVMSTRLAERLAIKVHESIVWMVQPQTIVLRPRD